MNKTFLIILTFILLLLLSFSCKKQTISKLDGKWKYWYLSKQDSGKVQFWEFREPNILFKTVYTPDTIELDTGFWKVDKDFLEPTFLEITGLGSKQDGVYQIMKLNKSFLFLQRYKLNTGSTAGAFSRLEFTKE